jgi:predicted outer membrane protein
MVPAIAVLAVCATLLSVPTQTGAADNSSVVDPVEATAFTPLTREGSTPGTGVGTPLQPGAPALLELAPSPAADDESVGPADLEVLQKVKQAGLWEMPVGMWASERAVNPRVREVGGLISAEHEQLDGIVTAAAAQLHVDLPTQPSPEQQGWMREIDAQRGAAFDERAVFLLRQAHGKVLPVLAQVRSATRNAVIRQMTTEAMTFVERHIEYLESTGLVAYEQLPGPADVGTDDWRSHAATFAVFALLAALFTTLLILVGRALTGWTRSRATTIPRPMARGHHARR